MPTGQREKKAIGMQLYISTLIQISKKKTSSKYGKSGNHCREQ